MNREEQMLELRDAALRAQIDANYEIERFCASLDLPEEEFRNIYMPVFHNASVEFYIESALDHLRAGRTVLFGYSGLEYYIDALVKRLSEIEDVSERSSLFALFYKSLEITNEQGVTFLL